jgi:hypothetical protein
MTLPPAPDLSTEGEFWISSLIAGKTGAGFPSAEFRSGMDLGSIGIHRLDNAAETANDRSWGNSGSARSKCRIL